jgi:hypothetical protein
MVSESLMYKSMTTLIRNTTEKSQHSWGVRLETYTLEK